VYNVHNYDPAIPDFAATPPRCDLVVCTDVLEHVEPDCIVGVLKDLDRVTGKVIFTSTALNPAMKLLPDGRNAHILLRPAHWWVDMFRKHTTLTITELRVRPIAVRIVGIRNEYALSK
jgi:2-polyprenyl-3-methyl-5-hydroxy-6-metoxy-1,4-benzoquinol methylase